MRAFDLDLGVSTDPVQFSHSFPTLCRGDKGNQEEVVRAPIPVRTERLYDDADFVGRRRQVVPVPQNVVDTFRDFEAGTDSLASLFEPPRSILFNGSFEEAKSKAVGQSQWLLVNVQSADEFASHQLNRDTWRHDAVQSLVSSNFVFYQVYNATEEGHKLRSYYKVLQVPAILVIDPITGAPMRLWTGFVESERLIEELLPFLDFDIHDPGASRLAAGAKRKASAYPVSQKHMTEEEEMLAAIEASMATIDKSEALKNKEEAKVESIDDAPSADVIKLAAAARLPEEPADGCRVAVRLPSGERLQRRFPRDANIQSIVDLATSLSDDIALGRNISLSGAFPGAPEIVDLGQTLETAGLADSIVVVRWKD